jgi:SOS-response transcriptional repressor LexA
VKLVDVRGNCICLRSRNDRHPDIEVTDTRRFELIGIVVGRMGAM